MLRLGQQGYMWGEAACSMVDDAMVDKAARDEAGDAALGKIAYNEVGEIALLEIHANMGMHWKRIGMALGRWHHPTW